MFKALLIISLLAFNSQSFSHGSSYSYDDLYDFRLIQGNEISQAVANFEVFIFPKNQSLTSFSSSPPVLEREDSLIKVEQQLYPSFYNNNPDIIQKFSAFKYQNRSRLRELFFRLFPEYNGNNVISILADGRYIYRFPIDISFDSVLKINLKKNVESIKFRNLTDDSVQYFKDVNNAESQVKSGRYFIDIYTSSKIVDNEILVDVLNFRYRRHYFKFSSFFSYKRVTSNIFSLSATLLANPFWNDLCGKNLFSFVDFIDISTLGEDSSSPSLSSLIKFRLPRFGKTFFYFEEDLGKSSLSVVEVLARDGNSKSHSIHNYSFQDLTAVRDISLRIETTTPTSGKLFIYSCGSPNYLISNNFAVDSKQKLIRSPNELLIDEFARNFGNIQHVSFSRFISEPEFFGLRLIYFKGFGPIQDFIDSTRAVIDKGLVQKVYIRCIDGPCKISEPSTDQKDDQRIINKLFYYLIFLILCILGNKFFKDIYFFSVIIFCAAIFEILNFTVIGDLLIAVYFVNTILMNLYENFKK